MKLSTYLQGSEIWPLPIFLSLSHVSVPLSILFSLFLENFKFLSISGPWEHSPLDRDLHRVPCFFIHVSTWMSVLRESRLTHKREQWALLCHMILLFFQTALTTPTWCFLIDFLFAHLLCENVKSVTPWASPGPTECLANSKCPVVIGRMVIFLSDRNRRLYVWPF